MSLASLLCYYNMLHFTTCAHFDPVTFASGWADVPRGGGPGHSRRWQRCTPLPDGAGRARPGQVPRLHASPHAKHATLLAPRLPQRGGPQRLQRPPKWGPQRADGAGLEWRLGWGVSTTQCSCMMFIEVGDKTLLLVCLLPPFSLQLNICYSFATWTFRRLQFYKK